MRERTLGKFAWVSDMISRAGVAMPSFWLSLLLVFIFLQNCSGCHRLRAIDSSFHDLPSVTGWMTIDTLLAGKLDAFFCIKSSNNASIYFSYYNVPFYFQITRARTTEIMSSIISVLHMHSDLVVKLSNFMCLEICWLSNYDYNDLWF